MCHGISRSLAMLSVDPAVNVGASGCDVGMSDNNGRMSDDNCATASPNAACAIHSTSTD